MASITYVQSTFNSMDREVDASLINKDDYPLLINGRVREGVVKPIKKPLEVTIANGLVQGVYGAGNYLVVFIAGMAYYKNFQYPNSDFAVVPNFQQMSATEPVIYVALVPESYTNYKRVHISDESASKGINLTSSVLSSPAAVVCQDGVNQPRLIISNADSVVAKTYGQWTVDGREYVPVGKQMLYSSGVLYLISSDGRRFYRSVTGRPLDFMVVVDSAGNKLADEAAGNADSIAHRVDYDVIRAVNQINDPNGAIYVSTERSSYLVRPLSQQIFGEPLFSNQFLFPTGVLNQFSTVDILGDTALIDLNGIKTFNSIQQTQVEGKNSQFSRKINGLFANITQSIACTGSFDNYALFAVDTIYGHGIIVYDTIRQAFVGLDIPTIDGTIKQFAEVKIAGQRRLFFITTANKLYEAFAGTTVERCKIYIGEFSTKDPRIEQKLVELKSIFINASEAGTVYATPYCDGKSSATRVQHITEVGTSLIPSSSADVVRNLLFNFTDAGQCWKFGIMLEWQFDAQLSFCRLDAEAYKLANTMEQTASQWRQAYTLPQLKSFAPSNSVPTGVIVLNGINLNEVTNLYLDDTEVATFTKTSTLITFIVPVGITGSYTIRLKSASGFTYSSTKLTIT